MSSPQINMMNKIKVRSIILLSILLLNQHYAKCNRSQNKNLNNLFSTPAKENDIEKTSTRNQKMIPIFQVIRFPNDGCTGGSRNGTCYTTEECSSRNGKQDGSCASGFGVCCVFLVSCGSTINDNCSYVVQTSFSSGVPNPCTYNVCPVGNNVCRIRYDFTIFTLTGPAVGTTATPSATTAPVNSIGHCVDDAFGISSPGTFGSPIICGTNTGYHMVIDIGSGCQSAVFTLNDDTTTSRAWDIKITQFACGDIDSGGPPGCLQYYKETYGIMQSFNFPTTTTVGSTATHLINQKYQICIRRGLNFCYICYSPEIAGTAVIAQISYGLSVGVDNPSPTIVANAATGTNCDTDFLMIPGALTAAIAATAETAITTPGGEISRFCGRFLNTVSPTTASITICSRAIPFRVGVVTDGTEVLGTATSAVLNEQALFPGGIIGFQLNYFQIAC